jgi:hypothetical protein
MGHNILVCAVCGLNTDSEMHVLFYCHFSRALWFASPLTICSEVLPANFSQLFMYLKGELDMASFKLFLNTLWSLWKARCAFVYEGKKLSPFGVIRVAADMTHTGLSLPKRILCKMIKQSDAHLLTDSCISCFVDGSYDDSYQGGYGGAAMIMKWGKSRWNIQLGTFKLSLLCKLKFGLFGWQFRQSKELI